jgi:hypothetical protein
MPQMFPQREFRSAEASPAMPTAPEEPAPPPWQPFGDRVIAPDALYVAIDELGDDVAVLVLASWPSLDEFGRLRFGVERDTYWIVAERLQRMVDFDRAQANADAPDRPLRVGDVFAVQPRVASTDAEDVRTLVAQSLSRDPMASTERRVELLDVSGPARMAAKTALYGAAAPAVSETYADRVRLRPDPAVWTTPPAGGS